MEHVEGFIKLSANEQGTCETLYARTKDGRIFAAGPHAYSSDFDKKGRPWSRVYAMPEGVDFIGNYPMPKHIVKWA